MRLQHLTPKAGYAPRGQRALALTAGKRIGANLISALANSGQLHFSLFDGRFTAQVFIDFLGRLVGQYPANINLDRELVEAAGAVLGKAQTTETVHAALRDGG